MLEWSRQPSPSCHESLSLESFAVQTEENGANRHKAAFRRDSLRAAAGVGFLGSHRRGRRGRPRLSVQRHRVEPVTGVDPNLVYGASSGCDRAARAEPPLGHRPARAAGAAAAGHHARRPGVPAAPTPPRPVHEPVHRPRLVAGHRRADAVFPICVLGLYAVRPSRRTAVVASSVVAFAAIALAVVHDQRLELSLVRPSAVEFWRDMDAFYAKPHTRFGSLFIGVLVVQIERSTACVASLERRPRVAALLAAAAVTVMALVVFVFPECRSPDGPRLVTGTIALALDAYAFAMAVGCLLLVSRANAQYGSLGRVVSGAFGWRVLHPVAQLSYAAFLVHPPLHRRPSPPAHRRPRAARGFRPRAPVPQLAASGRNLARNEPFGGAGRVPGRQGPGDATPPFGASSSRQPVSFHAARASCAMRIASSGYSTSHSGGASPRPASAQALTARAQVADVGTREPREGGSIESFMPSGSCTSRAARNRQFADARRRAAPIGPRAGRRPSDRSLRRSSSRAFRRAPSSEEWPAAGTGRQSPW